VSGLVIVLVGLILCFYGLGAIRLALLACGFGAAWLLADTFGASLGSTLVIAAAGALLAWLLAALIFGAASFFVGLATGAVIGAKLYTLLDTGSPDVLLAAVFVPAVMLVCGLLGTRWRSRFLVWVCAFSGAGLVLSGLGRALPRLLEFLQDPQTTAAQLGALAAWVALGLVGRAVQFRLFADRVHADQY
jgi:hypothetical protein